MVEEVSDNVGISFYEERAKGDLEGRGVIHVRFPRIESALETFNGISKRPENFHRTFKPLMSSCSKATVEVTFEDKYGNRVGIKGEFERDKDANSHEASNETSNTDSKPDSWDHDFDRD